MAGTPPPFNGGLSVNMVYGMGQWFENLRLANKLPTISSVWYYGKLDVGLAQQNAIVINPTSPSVGRNKKSGQPLGVMTDTIRIEVVFNATTGRELRQYMVSSTIDLIRGHIFQQPRNNENWLQFYLSKNFVPGLIRIYENTSKTNITSQVLDEKTGSLTVALEYDYEISLGINQKCLQQLGYDVSSPVTKIYEQITDFALKVEIAKTF